MADFEVSPVYSQTMKKVEEEPASAELFNVRFQDFLNNDAFLKQELDGLELVDSKVAVTDIKGHFTADKLDGVLDEIYTKASATEGRLDNKIGSLDTLQTVKKNNVVAAVNECFIKVNEVGENALTQRIYTAIICTTWVGTTAPFTQEITVDGIKGTAVPIVDTVLSTDIATALLQEKAWGHVSRITTSEDKIKVYCNKNKPVTAIPIQLKVVG